MQTQVTVKNGDSADSRGYGVDEALSSYNEHLRQPALHVTLRRTQAAPTPIFNFSRSKTYRHDKETVHSFRDAEILRTASAGTET